MAEKNVILKDGAYTLYPKTLLSLVDGMPQPTSADNGKILGVDNGAYALVEGGGGMSNPMTTRGDIIYASDNNGTPARLAKGTAGQVLTMNGQETAPIWQTLSVPLYRHDVHFDFEADNVQCKAVVSFINTVSTPYETPRKFYLYMINTFLKTTGDFYPINGVGQKVVDNVTYLSTVHYIDRLASAIRFRGICNNESYIKVIDDTNISGTGFGDTVTAI